jgi:hypothetical protein
VSLPKIAKGISAAVIAAFLLVQISVALAADGAAAGKATKHTIKDVMKGAYKGDASLRSKVVAGTATPEQKKQFLELTDALAANKPPKGDQGAWDAKTSALIKAGHDLLEGAPAAAATPDPAKLAAFKAASDCKSCHMAHKGN